MKQLVQKRKELLLFGFVEIPEHVLIKLPGKEHHVLVQGLALFGQGQFHHALILLADILCQKATLDQAGDITAQLAFILLGGAGEMAKRRALQKADRRQRAPLHQRQPILLDQHRLRMPVVQPNQIGKPVGKQIRDVFRFRPGGRRRAQPLHFAVGQIYI